MFYKANEDFTIVVCDWRPALKTGQSPQKNPVNHQPATSCIIVMSYHTWSIIQYKFSNCKTFLKFFSIFYNCNEIVIFNPYIVKNHMQILHKQILKNILISYRYRKTLSKKCRVKNPAFQDILFYYIYQFGVAGISVYKYLCCSRTVSINRIII